MCPRRMRTDLPFVGSHCGVPACVAAQAHSSTHIYIDPENMHTDLPFLGHIVVLMHVLVHRHKATRRFTFPGSLRNHNAYIRTRGLTVYSLYYIP